MQTNRMWLEEDTQARKKSNGIWETFVNISLELLGELKKKQKTQVVKITRNFNVYSYFKRISIYRYERIVDSYLKISNI